MISEDQLGDIVEINETTTSMDYCLRLLDMIGDCILDMPSIDDDFINVVTGKVDDVKDTILSKYEELVKKYESLTEEVVE